MFMFKHFFLKSARRTCNRLPIQFINRRLIHKEQIQSADPDTFGNSEHIHPELLEDAGDIKEEQYISGTRPTQRLSIKQYADIIKKHLAKQRLKEAIDVLEVQMLQHDRIKPENYIYNLLLGGCGRAGYTKKAFSLFNEMKKRGLKVTAGTYTALFNACANSPWPDTDGLDRAKYLRSLMKEKTVIPNDTNYNCMIKTFGRCGDLHAAFEIVDEMCLHKIPLRNDTFNFLLQACVSDRTNGFRHALLTWRTMVVGRIKPNIYTFNLMLRCARDCSLGEKQIVDDLMKRLLPADDKFFQVEQRSETPCIEEGTKMESTFYDPIDVQGMEMVPKTGLQQFASPNLLANVPCLGTIIELNDVTKPEDKLLLIGGLTGFLEQLQDHNCKPTIKTFTLLLDCIPGAKQIEEQLIKVMSKHNVIPDIDFYNILIKKRSMRREYHEAREVVNTMKEHKLRPNLMTYGVLAMGCSTKDLGESLIKEMTNHKYRLNIEILDTMMYHSLTDTNIPYVLWVMDVVLNENIAANKRFMEHLDLAKKKLKFISNNREEPLYHSKKFQREYKEFKLRYKSFSRDVTVENDKEHPWQQFRQDNQNKMLHYKDKVMRFKPKHTTKFRQKTTVSSS